MTKDWAEQESYGEQWSLKANIPLWNETDENPHLLTKNVHPLLTPEPMI